MIYPASSRIMCSKLRGTLLRHFYYAFLWCSTCSVSNFKHVSTFGRHREGDARLDMTRWCRDHFTSFVGSLRQAQYARGWLLCPLCKSCPIEPFMLPKCICWLFTQPRCCSRFGRHQGAQGPRSPYDLHIIVATAHSDNALSNCISGQDDLNLHPKYWIPMLLNCHERSLSIGLQTNVVSSFSVSAGGKRRQMKSWFPMCRWVTPWTIELRNSRARAFVVIASGARRGMSILLPERRQNVPKSYWVLDFANSSHLVGRTGFRDFVVISDETKIVMISCIVV